MDGAPQILTLPPELLERVIILLSQDNTLGPHSISALSKTSKHFYNVIYHPVAKRTDNYLWRGIFLQSFDDPRSALNRCSQAFDEEEDKFDWEEEYKARIFTSRVLMSSSDADSSLTYKLLRTIERILDTSLPFPLGTTITITLTYSSSSSANPISTTTSSPSQMDWSKYPAFPPLVLLLASKPSHIKATYKRTSDDDYTEYPLLGPYRQSNDTIAFDSDHEEKGFHHIFESVNCQWVEKLLGAKGYPLRLTRRIIGDSNLFPSHFALRSSPYDQSTKGDWNQSKEGKSFFKLVTFTGFLPIPKPVLYEADLAAARDGTKDNIDGNENLFGTSTQWGFVDFEDLDMEGNEYTNTDEAEEVEGRGHTLNVSGGRDPNGMAGGSSMNIVTGDITQDIGADMGPNSRNGSNLPYQYEPIPINPLHEPSLDEDTGSYTSAPTSSKTPPFPTREAQFTSARKWARRVVYDLRSLTRESGYGPFMSLKVPNSDGGTDVSWNDVETDGEVDGDDDFDTLLPFTQLLAPHHHNPSHPSSFSQDAYDVDPCSPNSVSPQLKPNWTWLAAARIVVEANLQDMLIHGNRDPNLLPPNEGGGSQNGSNRVLEQVGEALRRLEGLRMGGAPNYWRFWKGGDERMRKGEEVAEEDWDWDWAGVTGVWRSVRLLEMG